VSDKPVLHYLRHAPELPTEDGPYALPVQIWVVFGLVVGSWVLILGLLVLGLF
jgi:hypothetical protein